jgi:hypothetical protein
MDSIEASGEWARISEVLNHTAPDLTPLKRWKRIQQTLDQQAEAKRKAYTDEPQFGSW